MTWNLWRKKPSKRKSLALPARVDVGLKQIGQEVLRIHESAEFSAQAQFEQAKIWRTLNYWLGVPAAVAATLAGSAILSSGDDWNINGVSGSVIGGGLALFSAALSATLTTVNATRRMTQTQSSGNAYLQLQTEARQLAMIDLAKYNYDQARQAVDGITNSRDELNKTADVPSQLAKRRARKNLYKEGGQDYAVDQEA
ncbi:MAG: hypothetical protein JWP06_760 [Candidatus Saccharibacteria bacterium]|nr:hypothetical protein [Candidatus Saccharibacteria bacterium]